MTVEKARQINVTDRQDCFLAQQTARRLALAIGFSEPVSEEIVIVAVELSSNLIRHAGGGVLTFRPLQEGEASGIEIESVDEGPGIDDVDLSLADGYSTSGGLGYGLGAVNRLMDELDIASTPGLGTSVCCRRWRRTVPKPGIRHAWDVGAATRSRRFAPHNGDAYIVKETGGEMLVGVIDGLGHGELAQKASSVAQQYIRQHPDLALDKMFAGVSRACRGTRGVVMALGRFEGAQRLKFASVGNIETKAWAKDTLVKFDIKRGILGAGPSEVAVQQIDWEEGRILVLHSDGLRSNWHWRDFPDFERDTAQVLALRMLRQLASEEDDATVVVIRT